VTAKGTGVEPSRDIATADLPFDDEAADLWEPALPHLPEALAGRQAAFLMSLESAARGAGLTRSVCVADLLDAFRRGSALVREWILASGGDTAGESARQVLEIECAALTRIASGYSDGLGETIDRLSRMVEESSPFDADSGAMKPGEFGERLSLEVERCRRMDLPLGLLELSADADGKAGKAHMQPERADPRRVGACLRENLRRYDSVGRTDDGAFVLVLPDISRRGLAGAAERLRRELGECAGCRGAVTAEFRFALAHYDYVDANAQEMLTVLDHRLDLARRAGQTIAWA
jgi:hypothetical protein